MIKNIKRSKISQLVVWNQCTINVFSQEIGYKLII